MTKKQFWPLKVVQTDCMLHTISLMIIYTVFQSYSPLAYNPLNPDLSDLRLDPDLSTTDAEVSCDLIPSELALLHDPSDMSQMELLSRAEMGSQLGLVPESDIGQLGGLMSNVDMAQLGLMDGSEVGELSLQLEKEK